MLIIEQTDSEKLRILKDAIENKYEISFWYKGVKFKDPSQKRYTKQNWRFAQPVALGTSAGTGKWMLRAWQRRGTSNTKNEAWKTFLVDEMSNITVMDGKDGGYKTFQPASSYTGGSDKKMSNVTAFSKTGAEMGLNRASIEEPIEKPTQEPVQEPTATKEPITQTEPISKIEPENKPKQPLTLQSIIPPKFREPEPPTPKPLPKIIQKKEIEPDYKTELEPEPETTEFGEIKESQGFLKWILNLNHERKR